MIIYTIYKMKIGLQIIYNLKFFVKYTDHMGQVKSLTHSYKKKKDFNYLKIFRFSL